MDSVASSRRWAPHLHSVWSTAWPTVSGLDCACRYTSASTAWLLHTYKSCAGQSPTSTVAGTCSQLVEACWTSRELSCWHMEDVHSATPALPLGMLFLIIWRTVLFLCLSSETSSNVFVSHRTSTPSTFEIIAETHYINYLLACLLTYCTCLNDWIACVVHPEHKSAVDVVSSARLVGPAAPSLWSSPATAASNT